MEQCHSGLQLSVTIEALLVLYLTLCYISVLWRCRGEFGNLVDLSFYYYALIFLAIKLNNLFARCYLRPTGKLRFSGALLNKRFLLISGLRIFGFIA